MNPVPVSPTTIDGFGVRWTRVTPGGTEAILTLRPELTHAGSFEFAVRERVTRLSSFSHPRFAEVLGVERAVDCPGSISIVSDAIEGRRLSELLTAAANRELTITIGWASATIVKILEAIAALHAFDRDVTHGAIAPERIVVTDAGEPVIVDHVFGSALEQLGYDSERCWSELRVAVPRSKVVWGTSTDVLQVGAVAAALLLGRPLSAAENPCNETQLRGVLAAVASATPEEADLHQWLARVLGIAQPFASAGAAQHALTAIANRHRSTAGQPPVFTPAAASVAPVDLPHTETASQAVIEPPPVAAAVPAAVIAPVSQDIEPEPPQTVVTPIAETPHDLGEMAAAARSSIFGAVAPLATHMSVPMLVKVAAALAILIGATGLGSQLRDLAVSARAEDRSAAAAHKTQAPEGEAGFTPVPLVTGANLPSARATAEAAQVAAPAAPTAPPASVATPAARTPAAFTKQTNAAVPSPAPMHASASAAGWLRVSAPFDVRLFEEGRPLAAAAGGRIAIAPGEHALDLVNVSLGYNARRVVRIVAGRTTSLLVEAPTGRLAVNAVPWGDVWLDGERLGETPLANVAVPPGSHDLIIRHPSLGEQHRTVIVPAGGVTRIGVDLRSR